MLQFDSLEDRLLMAGNVSVFRVGNDLIVLGDSGDNELRLFTRDGATGLELVFEGVNGTRVNGGVSDVYQADSVRGTLRIDLGAGDDVLDAYRLSGLDGIAANGLTVLGNAGDDLLSFADIDLPGLVLFVYGGTNRTDDPTQGMTENDGDDLFSFGTRQGSFRVDSIKVTDWNGTNGLYLSNVIASGELAVSLIDYREAWGNENTVSLNRVSFNRVDVDVLGNSADTILVTGTTVTAGTYVSTDGNDDDVAVHGSTLGSLFLRTGTGADRQSVYESSVDWVCFVNAGFEHVGMADHFGLYNVNARRVELVTTGMDSGVDYFVTQGLRLAGDNHEMRLAFGDGDDVVIINGGDTSGSAVQYLLDMGEGDDLVCLNRAEFSGNVLTYRGGAGDDEFSAGNHGSIYGLSATDRLGNNGFFLSSTSFGLGGLSIDADGSDDNTLYMAGLSAGSSPVVYRGGAGADTVMIVDRTIFTETIRTSDFVISTGAGNDTVLFRDAIVNNSGVWADMPSDIGFDRTCVVDLGDGDDTLSVIDTLFAPKGVFRFDGGTGTNTATTSGSASTLAPEVIGLGSFTLPRTV